MAWKIGTVYDLNLQTNHRESQIMNCPHGLDYRTKYCKTPPIISQKIMKDNVQILWATKKIVFYSLFDSCFIISFYVLQ
jgi:hypothetical protein